MPRRVPHDEFRGEDELAGWIVGMGDAVEQQADGFFGDLLRGD